jgi:hypothetical protein
MHDDFRVMLWFVWRELGLPEPTVRQYAIAWFLQHGPKRLMIMAFRGIGKSWITAVFAIWLLMRNADERVLVISASEQKAVEFCTFVKRLIREIPLFQRLRPKGDQRNSTLAFDVGPSGPHQAPSVRAVGIGGQITGGRASIIIPDDVEIPRNSRTQAEREKLAEQISELGGSILMPEVGRVAYLGTPQNVQTVYAKLPERGYEIRVWPAQYTDGLTDEGEHMYLGQIDPEIAAELAADPSLMGKPTDPVRFDVDELMEREAEYGRSGYQLQYQLNTTLSDAERYPLKCRDLIVSSIDNTLGPVKVAWAADKRYLVEDIACLGLNGDRYYGPMYVSSDFKPYQGRVLFVDPSGRGKDETAYAVLYSLNGTLFLKKWGGLPGGYDDETLLKLCGIAKDHDVNEVHIEGNWGDGMYLSLLSPHMTRIHPVSLVEYRVTGQKEQRIIDKLEPTLNQHRLVVDPEALSDDLKATQRGDGTALAYSSIFQLTHLTKDRGSLKQDDRVDVLAEAVGYFTEQLKKDSKESEREYREEQMKKALEAHARAAKRGTSSYTMAGPYVVGEDYSRQQRRPKGRVR